MLGAFSGPQARSPLTQELSVAHITKRQFITATGATLAVAAAGGYALLRPRPAPIGFAASAGELAQARAFLASHISIDAHAHPGRTFMRGAEHVSGKLYLGTLLGTFEDTTVRDMKAGGLSAAAFAAVSDFQSLGFKGEGLGEARAFEPGEAWASYRRQIANLQALSKNGLVYPILAAGDFEAARAAGKPGAFLTVEGGDFLEGKAERVAQAYADGVRSITPMHYRTNELGDTITGKVVHRGLSIAGAEVVKAMNEIGMLIDVAHASEATAFAIIAASAKPVIASHVHIHGGKADHPRFISRDLAKAVAQKGGGVLGAWPAGIGITDLGGYVARTLELIAAVGIDHVCLGTDMDGNYKPVFDSYARLPWFVVGLRQHGMGDADLAKLIGGNFLRLFAAA